MKSNLPLLRVSVFCLVTFFSINVFSQELMLTPAIPANRPSSISAIFANTKQDDNNLELNSSQTNRLKSLTASQLSYEWGKYMATSYDDRFYSNSIDLNGNVIAAGSKGYSSSDIDAIIYKFDNSGELLWSDKPCSSSSYDAIYDVTTDNIDNIYVTGQFGSSAFNDKIYSYGNTDIFIAKYHSNGDLLWAKSAGGADYDFGGGIETDSEGNVYVVGIFNGFSYWGSITKTSSEHGDMFIAKYDKNGNVKWVRTGQKGEDDYIVGIDVDLQGNVYVSAHFTETFQFEGAPQFDSNGETDMFLIKYDSNGQFKWVKTAGGGESDGGNDVSVDHEGNIHVTGYFRGESLFDYKILNSHGEFDIFDAKYSGNGTLLWVKQFGGNGSQTGWDVETDEIGNSYITGWFSGIGAFDNTTIVSKGGEDAYLIKYDKNGNLVWVEQTAAGINDEVCNDVSVKGSIIAITGRFEGEMDIKGSEFPYSGGEDAYMAKLTQSDVVLPSVYVNPSLTLSAAQINQGQIITFSGQQFNPFGRVDLTFTGAGTINPIYDYSIDVDGNFQYTLSVPNTQIEGEYIVTATDKISGKSISRSFIIISQQVGDDFLQILQPNISKIRYTNEPIIFSWEDRANPSNNFWFSYTVQFQMDNGSWEEFYTVQGNNSGYGKITQSVPFTPTTAGAYKLKVTDNNNSSRYKTTPVLPVQEKPVTEISVDFVWDKSYPWPTTVTAPTGAAAEGVARFFMVVSNNNSSNKISGITVNLTDENENNGTTQFLGKVMYSSLQNDSFSDEANDANSTVANKTSNNLDDKYWFWYVAPDDFSRNEGDWDKDERLITANFEVALVNGNKATIKKEIKIVRPPLMLVHGLVGYPSTWDFFPTRDTNTLFINDKRFKSRRAVAVSPNADFNTNSSILLADVNNENSFKALINDLRNMGYACNQLDYVCHSMGGVIFRDAVERTDRYYMRIVNYSQGFANKYISLHTPHDGSSYANFLVDIDNDFFGKNSFLQWELGKRELFECSNWVSCKVVGAVEDLRYLNGIKFNETRIPSHLIGSGVDCSNYPSQTLENLLKIMSGTSKLDENEPCASLDNYFTTNGFEDYFAENNDAIVSAVSQFSRNNINSLPTYCTWFDGLMHNSSFGNSPTRSLDVGKLVDKLLNSNVNSNLFGNIPATNIETKSVETVVKSPIAFSDEKVIITYPVVNSEYNTGDTINIQLQIETEGLESVALFFQGKSYFETPTNSNVEFHLIISDEYIEGQTIFAMGRYIESDSVIISSDSKEIKINPGGTIVDFDIEPEIIVIEKSKTRLPNYKAIFPNAIAHIGQTNLFSVTINNPNLVEFDSSTNKFIGKDVGNTFGTVTYRGKSKIVSFQVIQYEEPATDPPVGINDFDVERKNTLNVKTYPNPFTQEITFEFAATADGDLRMEITKINGQIVKSYIFKNQLVGLNSKTIDLSELSDGIYLYKLLSENDYQVGKIVKKKND